MKSQSLKQIPSLLVNAVLFSRYRQKLALDYPTPKYLSKWLFLAKTVVNCFYFLLYIIYETPHQI